MTDHRHIFEQLKRRKIVQWTIAYLSAAWLILQVVDVIGEQFEWPLALERGITATLAGGLLVTLVLSWFHGEKGEQRVTRVELLALSMILVVSGFIVRAVTTGGDTAAQRNPAPAGLLADPNAIVVAPFTASTADSALERLGRDLSFTVAATLDGINDLRTVDPQTVLARVAPAEGALSLPAAVALADELGAGRVLHGSITRAGEQVRVDATLYAADGARVLARVTSLHEPSRVAALTDAIVLSVARQLWGSATPDIPSTASLSTSNIEALRAYLDGEHALASGEMSRAIASFDRAYALDSTYLFAYWRSLYPRTYEGSRPDSAAFERLVQRRHELPLSDRLLVEAAMAPTLSEERSLLETAVRRTPTHWPAWYTYANLLVHGAPYIGSTYEEARAALERVIQLNPRFGPAWEHLFWIVAQQRDTAATRSTLAALEQFSTPSGTRFNEDLLILYRTVADAVLNDDTLSSRHLHFVTDYILHYRGPIPPQSFGIGLLIYGTPRAQMQVNAALLQAGASGPLAQGALHGIALGAAARGAWDSAGAVAARWARMDGTFPAALAAYGLVTTGAALGYATPGDAARLRPAEPEDAAAEHRAELVWLDGVLAWARRDAAALGRHRRALANTGSSLLPLLGATLDAFALELSGDGQGAAQLLSAAEDSAGERARHFGYARTHPYLTTVNRLLASRWLLDDGNAPEAARLLTFTGTVLSGVPALHYVNMSIGRTGLYYRARAEEAMGRERDAWLHYERFIDQFDLPDPTLEPLLRDARTRLARLSPG